MLKKLSMPMAVGECAFFTLAGSDREPRFLCLTDLKVTRGVLSWEMMSDDKQIVIGNATAETLNPFFRGRHGNGCWIKPCIPIRMHVRNGGLAVDMIFRIPNACFIKITPNAQSPIV